MSKLGTSLCAIAITALATTATNAAPPTPAPLDVNVTNNPVPVRDVDNAARQPIQFALCNTFGATGACAPSQFSVQSGKRLVIENIAGQCTKGGTVNYIRLGVVTVVNGTSAEHRLQMFADPVGGFFFDIAQQTRIYADGGSIVSLNLASSFADGAAGLCNVTFSGYTVTL